MTEWLWAALSFFSGSLLFSLWIGRLALGKDIRAYGDGNPGASNVFRAGGKGWAVVGVLLDALKGAVPVGMAKFALSVQPPMLILIAVAPILGHAFSPFVRGRGGKAVAVTFGIWTGLTLWEVPTVLGVLLGTGMSLIGVSGWALLFAQVGLLGYLLLTSAQAAYLLVWLVSTVVFIWKYRADLRQFPQPQRWLGQKLGWYTSSSS